MKLQEGASLSTIIIAFIGVLGILGGVVGLWVDARITKKLQPIINMIQSIKGEHMPNGGVHPRPSDGKPDGTSKDLQADTLALVKSLTVSVAALTEQVNKPTRRTNAKPNTASS